MWGYVSKENIHTHRERGKAREKNSLIHIQWKS